MTSTLTGRSAPWFISMAVALGGVALWSRYILLHGSLWIDEAYTAHFT